MSANFKGEWRVFSGNIIIHLEKAVFNKLAKFNAGHRRGCYLKQYYIRRLSRRFVAKKIVVKWIIARLGVDVYLASAYKSVCARSR